MWGQGDMMREDETIEETRVRLHWVYCLDGPIAGLVLLDAFQSLHSSVARGPKLPQRRVQLLAICTFDRGRQHRRGRHCECRLERVVGRRCAEDHGCFAYEELRA